MYLLNVSYFLKTLPCPLLHGTKTTPTSPARFKVEGLAEEPSPGSPEWRHLPVRSRVGGFEAQQMCRMVWKRKRVLKMDCRFAPPAESSKTNGPPGLLFLVSSSLTPFFLAPASVDVFPREKALQLSIAAPHLGRTAACGPRGPHTTGVQDASPRSAFGMSLSPSNDITNSRMKPRPVPFGLHTCMGRFN